MLLRRLTVTCGVVASVLLAGSGCGSSGSSSTASGGTGRPEASAPRGTASGGTERPATGAPRGGPCDLLTREEVSAATGRTVTAATEKELAGIRHCYYSFDGNDPDASVAVVVVSFHTGREVLTLFDLTKGNGESVPDLGEEAVWDGHNTVEVKANGGVLTVNTTIVITDEGDAKTAAVRLARTALGRI